jgi:hypothetical protein
MEGANDYKIWFKKVVIEGNSIQKNAHYDCKSYFEEAGYSVCVPFSNKTSMRDLLSTFYKEGGQFETTAEELKDVYTVFKHTENYDVQFACTFTVLKLASRLVGYIFLIKTGK